MCLIGFNGEGISSEPKKEIIQYFFFVLFCVAIVSVCVLTFLRGPSA